MNITIGYLDSYDQRVTMQMVYSSGVYFYEDNIFKLSSSTFHWALIYLMNMYERGNLCFLGVLVTHISIFSSNMKSSKDNQYFSYSFWLLCIGRSFIRVTWGSSSKNSLKCPSLINLYISSLRALHFTVLCPIYL